MKKSIGKKALCCLLILLLAAIMPVAAQAAGENAFILVAEAGGELIIAPEYVTYTAGQTVQEALAGSGHVFAGLDEGMITAIDGVVGNFTRSDENGSFALEKPAAEVRFYRFSEDADSMPSSGLQQLMTSMAAYSMEAEDVRMAAKDAYDTAYGQFAGIDSASAKTLAERLNTAIAAYKSALNGPKYNVQFTDNGVSLSDASITAQNAYGKVWAESQNGSLQLPAGNYQFAVEKDGVHAEGGITVSGDMTVRVQLPHAQWLKLDAFRLSGSYGADDNAENRFIDGEFALGAWSGRQVTALVPDTFTGAVYAYAQYDTSLLSKTPTLTAIYTMCSTGEIMEKPLVWESKISGAYSVLHKGAAGNQVIYRVSSEGADGYTYSQDYTVRFERRPTLTGLRVTDQEGAEQAAAIPFDGNVTEYTYKVLDTVTAVTVHAIPLDSSYTVTVNGKNAANGVTIAVSGETKVEVIVAAGGHSNAYTLTIRPGEGKTLSFVSDRSVTIEVVNSNGVVMPYTTYRETASKNRYQYTLVPGEVYSYIATNKTYYHIADDFIVEEVANSTITVDFSSMGDWLTDLSFGQKAGNQYKGTLPLNTEFAPDGHCYEVTYVDTEHNPYIWVTGSQSDVTIEASYRQVFSAGLYHGKQQTKALFSGAKSGVQLNRFLMDENPIENTVTIRLSREQNGLTYYQEYVVNFRRSLTLGGLSVKCDGIAAILTQENGTTGFAPEIKAYSVTVSMAAERLDLAFARYTENTCYGENEVGYRVLVDGQDVTQTDSAAIWLDGTLETQTVVITVENDKASYGAADYVLHILKSPPVEAAFALTPTDALLTLYETTSGERLWPDSNGRYPLCEGYRYVYTLTKYGYVGQSGTLSVTRDADNRLVVTDGTESYLVTETENGSGYVQIDWRLVKAEPNSSIDPSMTAAWPSFRGNAANNGVTNAAIPTVAERGTLYWANQIGHGFDSDAVGSPILVDGDLITYSGNTIYRVDTMTGQIVATGTMDHKSSFAITPPVYADGILFVALSNGTVQAFHASTLESLWVYADPLGGQPNCPMTVKNGYLYTGFWNSETGAANFVCLSITDEDPDQSKEAKTATWHYTHTGGFYWAGAYVSDEFVLVGTDDGYNGYTSQTSRLLLLDCATGALLDSWDGLHGDVRSTVVYDSATDAYYFTSKGGTFYSVRVASDMKLTNKWSVSLRNGVEGIPMSTSSPVVYNGRAYVGVSGAGQFSSYSGHNISIIDLNKKAVAYCVETQGYPQTSGLLTTAYEAESGYVYVYFFDNMTPGKLRVLRDKAGQTQADYVTAEGSHTTAYALFTPTGNQAEYAICSPIVDEYGTVYFKNDSAHLMAYGSTIEKLEVTKLPDKTTYRVGDTFDPTGMVVTATYANGKTRDVTKYVTFQTEGLTEADGAFAISYQYGMYHNVENGTSMTAGIETETPVTILSLAIRKDETLGDVNGDGLIDQKDAQMILDYEAKKLAELPLAISDVSGDGIIDSNDAVLILQYVDGTIASFPAAG